MTKNPTISVVIPSWNSKQQLKKNLPAVLAAAKQVNAEIILVDDKSTEDQTVAYLNTLSKEITVLLNKTNRGFAETVNQGVTHAQGDIVILLNTDVCPAPDCFLHARSYFNNDSVYAVAFNSGEGWMGGEWKDGLFHHFRVEDANAGKKTLNPSLWASGGQAAFDRKKWMMLGGMDSLYKPFYWEDTDMGYRAWKRGWQVLWARECRVVHDHKESVIASNFSQKHITQTAARNQFLFIWKNISDPYYVLTHVLCLPYYLIKYTSAVLAALRLLPQVLKKRAHESSFWKRADHDILALWVR